ncbi:hypothetical protein [Paenibacillus sp. J2TS4]|uniref:hypothetical protein n=1 Tax=Paenibacillus sp. J2TS4 TaxID=2807194 RepID=UPI001B0E2C3F|nr:hypothetical protein [Paenibacillus sp. J2TS4]GIP32526.1 hypothetical protein J2TS4_17360 [Paenibacillus sp. J2TS4]
MYSIQIGSLVLNGPLLLYLSFGAAGWLMLRFGLRHMPERGLILSCAANAFWLWLMIWKGSFLILHPVEAIQRPASLLYFDGGERGRWLASLAAAVYVWRRASKQSLHPSRWINSLVLYFLAGWLVYHLLLFAFGEETHWIHAASAGLTASLLMSLLLSPKGVEARQGRGHALWFLIGHAVLWFLIPERPIWFLSFSKQQIIFLLAAAGLIGWIWFDERMHKGGTHG